MKKIVYLFLLLFVLTIITCRKPGERDTIDSHSLKEDLDSIPLVVVSDKGVEIFDLRTLDTLRVHSKNISDLVESVLRENEIYIVCHRKVLWFDREKDELVTVSLPFTVSDISLSKNTIILYGKRLIYELSKDAKISKLVDFKRDIHEVHALPDYSSFIVVFKKDEVCELMKYSLLLSKEERQSKISDLIRMKISPFGKRMYALTKKNISFIDTKDLRLISKIPFKGVGTDFIITASENKIFVFTQNPAKIYSIKRTLLKIESEIKLPEFPEKRVITGDGGTIFFIAQDTLFRFDTGNNGVVKKSPLEKKCDILVSTQKGSRIILGTRGESYYDVLDANTLQSLKKISIKGKLLDIICGKERYTTQFEEPSPPETTKVDTMLVDTVIPDIKNPERMYFTLQVSSSSIREGAVNLYKKIKVFRLPVYIDSSEVKDGQKFFKVRVGAFEGRDDAESFKDGLQVTHDLTSWVSSALIEPSLIIRGVGLDINGDGNGEVLLHDGKRVLIFTDFNGTQKMVFKRDIPGVKLKGTPVTVKDGDQRYLGFSFASDSALIVKWIGGTYEMVREKIPGG